MGVRHVIFEVFSWSRDCFAPLPPPPLPISSSLGPVLGIPEAAVWGTSPRLLLRQSCSLRKAAGLPCSQTGNMTVFALLSTLGAELITSEHDLQTVHQAFASGEERKLVS